jgi:hypothetical protein
MLLFYRNDIQARIIMLIQLFDKIIKQYYNLYFMCTTFCRIFGIDYNVGIPFGIVTRWTENVSILVVSRGHVVQMCTVT